MLKVTIKANMYTSQEVTLEIEVPDGASVYDLQHDAYDNLKQGLEDNKVVIDKTYVPEFEDINVSIEGITGHTQEDADDDRRHEIKLERKTK